MNKRYALCIGNNYPGTTSELGGCVNDARDWGEMLARNGYEVSVLTEVPKAAAITALRSLVARAGFADRVVFTYSGHGSYVVDRDGDEADGRDECLLMADYKQGGYVTDDELQQIFSGLRLGAGALILSDSCHSGTVSRFVNTHGTGTRPRFISPVEFTDISEEAAARVESAPASKPRQTASLISGCGDLEYSYDTAFGGRGNGAFTRTAIDAYVAGDTLPQWYSRIRDRLPTTALPQTPQLTLASPYRQYAKAL